MINEFKEDMNKHLNEFNENINRQVNEIRNTTQEVKENLNKDIKILGKIKLKFWK
jgi:tryptophanyl-tRNA synthetase